MGRRKEPEMEPRPREYWRDIPGYDGKYQASTEGRVRRRKKNGQGWEQVRINEFESRRSATVYLTPEGGKRKECMLLRIVAMTWWPEKYRPELQVIHKNGLHSDNSAYNCEFVNRADRMRKTCAGIKRRAVYHIGPNGEILDVYPSGVAAGRAHGLSNTAVCMHCKGQCGPRWDGTTFRYADMEKAGRKKRGGT